MAPIGPSITALCQKLKTKLGADFDRDVFDACLLSLQQANNPLKLNNFATGLRELSRIVLARLAPDESIQKCSWYQPATNQNGQTVITRAQRIAYAVQGGLEDGFVVNTLGINVDQMRKTFGKVVDQLSKFTHIGPATFGVGGAAVDKVAQESLEAFLALFAKISECRTEIEIAVGDQVRQSLHDELLRTAVNELDELATHYQVEDTGVDTISIRKIDDAEIVFHVTGTVECQFQYGSGSDIRNGDGVITNDSYPLTCDFVSNVRKPLDVSAKNGTLAVDNSSFYV
jgi:hypothetical protein